MASRDWGDYEENDDLRDGFTVIEVKLKDANNFCLSNSFHYTVSVC